MILAAATPRAWLEAAGREWETLLVDHANCEKKAASTALSLLFAYPEDRALGTRMSRLAREELRHFEQVDRLMTRLGVAPRRLGPGRYAGELRRACASAEPRRRLDLMICGALIEARSCERFDLLAPVLPSPIGAFYGDLAEAERRHATLYVDLAHAAAALAAEGESASPEALFDERLAVLAGREAELATHEDPSFRFHSGPPPACAPHAA